MVEQRIRRALWAISVLVIFGFGARAAYKIHYERLFEVHVQELNATISERSEECARERKDYLCDRIPHWRELRREVLEWKNEAGEEARSSIVLAITIPLSLWGLFFLSRWIWTGHVVKSRLPRTEKRTVFTKKVLYWGLGLVGFAALFGVNVAVLPPARAMAVLISSLVQVLGLVLVFWIAAKIREVIKRRAEHKRATRSGD